MMLPPAADLTGIDNLQDLRTLIGLPTPVWTAFIHQVGDPGTSIFHLAALPGFITAQACAAATFAGGTRLHTINATQVGLLWRVARKSIFFKNGGVEADFADVEPWDNPSQTPPGQGVFSKWPRYWTSPTNLSWCPQPRTRCRSGVRDTSQQWVPHLKRRRRRPLTANLQRCANAR